MALSRRFVFRLLITLFGESGQVWLEAQSLTRKLQDGFTSEQEIALLNHLLRPGDTCLDIGANCGQWTYWLSKAVGPGGRVIAVEPVPVAARVLRRVTHRLELSNVEIKEVAVGDRVCQTRMVVTRDGLSRLQALATARLSRAGDSPRSTIPATMVTLTSLVHELGIDRVHFVKCDTEGAELQCFTGGRAILSRDNPAIICEIEKRHTQRFGYSPEDVFALLTDLGYRSFTYCAGELSPTKGPRPGAINYVFLHPRSDRAVDGLRGQNAPFSTGGLSVAQSHVSWITGGRTDRPTGGIKYADEVTRGLRSAGWSVDELVLPAEPPGRVAKRHVLSNVRIARRLLPRVAKKGILVEPASFHSRLFLFNWLVRWLRRARLVTIVHHMDYHGIRGGPLWRAIDKRLEALFYRTVHHIVVVSEATKREVMDVGVSEERISVVPDGLDPPDRPEITRADDRLSLLFVGTCHPRKGLPHLLDAMQQLRNRDIVLNIVGNLGDDPEYALRLQKYAEEHGLDKTVVFHGWLSQEELHCQYARAHVFVLPSLWEGFGIVLLEAMAFGLPVIATSTGAIPELVEDGVNGLVVPPRDSQALARAISRLLDSPTLRMTLGHNAMLSSQNALTWQQASQLFSRVLRTLAGQTSS